MIEGLRARRRQGVAVYVRGKGKHEKDYFYLSTVSKNVCRRSGTGRPAKRASGWHHPLGPSRSHEWPKNEREKKKRNGSARVQTVGPRNLRSTLLYFLLGAVAWGPPTGLLLYADAQRG